jgi:hypothetical protein
MTANSCDASQLSPEQALAALTKLDQAYAELVGEHPQ